tara:strand:- start:181 stop:741 length:561 start_codon:yes stop_codon:yes gene_type:complete
MYTPIYNPIALNLFGSFDKAYSSDERTKFICGQRILVEEKTVSEGDGVSLTKVLSEYMWVEAGDDFDAGQPGIITPGTFQSEAILMPLYPATGGAIIGWPTVGINSGQFTLVKLSGKIVTKADENVESNKYVKISLDSEVVTLGNESGEVNDGETIGIARTDESGGNATIYVLSGRTVELKEEEEI